MLKYWQFEANYGIMFEEQFSRRTDVVHAFGTSPRGPRVG